MGDISKLPKWAQKEIQELKESKQSNEYGAYIGNCSIEHNAIKHTKDTTRAICSLADALSKNADAIKEVAKSLSGTGVNVQFGHGISISDVKHSG